VIFLIYGFLTEQSIGKLFLAGILPGVLLTLLFMLTVAIVAWRNPSSRRRLRCARRSPNA
jgi:TRAP-type C4-dicarboxylate transport system permease large subunit